jgi:hypothetical protein
LRFVPPPKLVILSAPKNLLFDAIMTCRFFRHAKRPAIGGPFVFVDA